MEWLIEKIRFGSGRKSSRPTPPDFRASGILSAGIFAFTLSRNEFLFALVFLIHARVENGAGGRGERTDPRGHFLLGVF